MSTSIERTEAAIKNGTFGPVLKYRIYKLTTSVAHLQGGADFMLHMSFDDEADAEEELKEVIEGNFYAAVIVH